MELVNAVMQGHRLGYGGADPAVREATEAVAIMLSLVAPYTAEDMWARLGHEPCVALAVTNVDEALLVADSVTCVVRSRAKCERAQRSRPRSPRTNCASWFWPNQGRQCAGRSRIRTVIVRAPKLVNVVNPINSAPASRN